jgi:predicted acetyltransferase
MTAVLTRPSRIYLPSYIEACREFKKLGLLAYSFNDPDTRDEWEPELFCRYENNRLGIDLPEDYVPSTTFWLVEKKKYEFIAEGNVRHELTPALRRFGGHIGYAVCKTAWNKGYGTLLLGLLLAEAAKMGIPSVLITCNDENVASVRVIEKNGGVLQDVIDNVFEGREVRTRRYWVRT